MKTTGCSNQQWYGICSKRQEEWKWKEEGRKRKKKKEEEKEKKQEDKKSNYFELKECFICGTKGHGAKKCPSHKKKDDNASVNSKSSKTSIEEFKNKLKTANKQFVQLKSQIAEEYNDLDNEDQSNFPPTCC